MADAIPILTGAFDYVKIFFIYFSWWVVPILMLVAGKMKWARHPLEAWIIEKRGDNLIFTNDRIGRLHNKSSGHTVYRLLKMGDTIDVLPFDTVMHKTTKNTNFLEYIVNKLRPTIGTVMILKYGSKQYKPIKITAGEKGMMAKDEDGNIIAVTEMLDKLGNLVIVEQLMPIDIRKHLGVIDFQVIDWDDVNTTMNEIENSRTRRLAKWDTMLKFVLPIAILGVVGVIAIVLLYLSYDADIQFCNAAAEAPTPIMTAPLGGNNTIPIPVINQMI